MRIAFITHYTELYGANRSLLDLIHELRSKGLVDPVVIAPKEGPLTTELDDHHIGYHLFDFQLNMSERKYMGRIHHRIGQHRRYEKAAKLRVRHNAKLIPQIARFLTDEKIQLIHANSSVIGIAPILAEQAKLPLVWHIREMPETHYGFHIDQGRRAHGKVLRSATRLIAISQAAKQDAMRYIGRPWPVSVIYNGILPQQRYKELQKNASQRWVERRPFIFVMIGLIHPSKGQLEAVEAIHDLSKEHKVELWIAGTGRDKLLNERIEALGVSGTVRLLGFVEDPYSILQQAHALLMCSHNEAMGRVTVEAMACGIPVVGLASGGTKELVEHDVTGLLYTGGPRELRKQMERLLSDEDLPKRLGKAGALDAAAKYSVERYAEQVWQEFQQAVTGQRSKH